MAEAAVAVLVPAIRHMLRQPQISPQGVLHVVVLDPLHGCSGYQTTPRLLWAQSIGGRSRWEVDHGARAMHKAQLSWRYRVDSRQLHVLAAHRLAGADAALWGGVWVDGLVVAASGAAPAWDECFALMVAAQLRARAWEAVHAGPADA